MRHFCTQNKDIGGTPKSKKLLGESGWYDLNKFSQSADLPKWYKNPNNLHSVTFTVNSVTLRAF